MSVIIRASTYTEGYTDTIPSPSLPHALLRSDGFALVFFIVDIFLELLVRLRTN